MSTNKNNNIFEKTSFLGNNSSEFVETLYAEYLKNPEKLSEEWRKFFEGVNDDKEKILKNANGPSWSPKKKIKVNNYENLKNVNKQNGNQDVKSDNQDILYAAKDI